MPDFFGDDVVFDARRSSGDQLDVPADNILLSFTGGGDTILMTVWPAGDQEVQALLGADKAGRFFEAMEFTFDSKSLYFAAQLRALAGAQDTLAALCRCEVRLFRRELGVIAAGDRSVAKFAEKLRDLARNALRKKHYTEGE